MCFFLVPAVYYVVSEPIELRAPLEFETFVDLRSEMLLCFFVSASQDKDTSQVLQILNTLQFWDTSALHLVGRKEKNKREVY